MRLRFLCALVVPALVTMLVPLGACDWFSDPRLCGANAANILTYPCDCNLERGADVARGLGPAQGYDALAELALAHNSCEVEHPASPRCCGLGICAMGVTDARQIAAAAVGVRGDDARLVCTCSDNRRSAWEAMAPTYVDAWQSAGGQCLGVHSDVDAGAPPDAGSSGPCALVGERCAPGNRAAGLADCCETQQIASGRPPSRLDCEPDDIDSDTLVGTCRVGASEPCTSEDQCQVGVVTPDGAPAECTGPAGEEVCCYAESRQCWTPGGPEDNLPRGGCCPGLSCVADVMYSTYWCQYLNARADSDDQRERR